ncbi:MAG: peptidoglycan recognition family protein [Chthoniobacteraceae bacterium]
MASPRATSRPSVTPSPVVRQTPSPRRKPLPPAPVVVEKSGYEEERGLQPAASVGWFTRWKYLSKSVRQQIDRAPVQKRRWRYIVIHNSATRQGSAKAFEYYHKRVRKMPNGLAYHFVIGNGTSTGDGEIEIGNRWKRQINGGHVHSDYLNNIALGICFVGDFNRDKPTARQIAACEELVRYLRQRVGKIDRKWAIVKSHRAINPPRWPTDCPGDKFPYRWLDAKFQ